MERRAAGLKDKMPDIQKTLETVQFLKTRKVRGLRISVVPGLTKVIIAGRLGSNRSYV